MQKVEIYTAKDVHFESWSSSGLKHVFLKMNEWKLRKLTLELSVLYGVTLIFSGKIDLRNKFRYDGCTKTTCSFSIIATQLTN